MGLAESYKRWRHTRGYGVHSPFAYGLIKNVLRPGRGYAYYAYHDIEAVAQNTGGIEVAAQACMLFRLITWLGVRSVWMGRDVPVPYRQAAKCAGSKMRIESNPGNIDHCQLLTASVGRVDSDVMVRHLQTPGNILAVSGADARLIDVLAEKLPRGLILRGKHNALFINRDAMQKVSYSVCI